MLKSVFSLEILFSTTLLAVLQFFENCWRKQIESILKFNPRARIIRTIGDEMISGPEAAIVELVKNAYDADASRVTVKFSPPLRPGCGRIEIIDNGHGMDLQTIRNKWMEPATTSKLNNRKSPKKRAMMGSKGIGRFAAAKLGQSMSLHSVVDNNKKKIATLIPNIDWNDFDGEKYLSDIEVDYIQQDTKDEIGTIIEINDLRERWNKVSLTRLLLELRRLVSPFELIDSQTKPFKIFLDLSECTKENSGFDGKELVSSSFKNLEDENDSYEEYEVKPYPALTECDYEVSGKFDKNGKFIGTFQVRRADMLPEEISFTAPPDEDEGKPGEFDVQLYVFDREAKSIKENMLRAGLGELSTAEARKILDEVAGVAIYRNNFRVRPYGDVKSDWLTLDTRRVQDPSRHIGHN